MQAMQVVHAESHGAAPLAPVSAVIPCHNAAPYLSAAIASVRAQARPVDEVIVVDDASTDGSGDIASALGATVIRLPTQSGNGAARNVGLRAAQHDLVGLLDADDEWLPIHCERLVPLLERYPEAAVAFAAMRLTGNATGVYHPWLDDGPPQWAFDRCLVSWIGLTSCVIRRSAALSVGGFDEHMPVGVDFDMWLRLAPKYPFVATQEVTGLYRRHAGQISNRRLLQTEMCYRSRRRAWDALVQANDTEAAQHAAAIIRDTYGAALQRAWDAQNREELAALVAFAPLVPDGEPLRRMWARRLALPRVLIRAWSGAGEGVRKPLRQMVHWFESRTGGHRQR